MKDVENNDEEPAGLEKVGDSANEVVADRVGMVDSNRTSAGNSATVVPSETVYPSETVVPSEMVVPEEVQPTYVPAALAMGIMMLLWGILTNWIMSAAGALQMIWAVAEWVKEMHEI